MKKLFAGFIAVFTGSAVLAQVNPEKYAATITKEDLKKHLMVIAGAEMEGRKTATEGQRKAASYIAEQFKKTGLLPAPGTTNYQQEFPLYYDSIKRVDLTINSKLLSFGKDYIVSATLNPSKNLKSKDIVFVGYGISDSLYNDYQDRKVRGKTVLMFAGEPKSSDTLYTVSGSTRPSVWSYPNAGMEAKVALAQKKGARAVLYISPASVEFKPEAARNNRKTDIYFSTGHEDNNINSVFLSHDAAAGILGKKEFDTLLTRVKSGQPLNNEKLTINKRVKFTFEKAHILRTSTNVVGYIEGKDKKNEYLLITAHYDHLGRQGDRIFYGADDDGSGTVSVIEIAEAFARAKAQGNGPRRTVVFMTVSGEEEGLWGSEYYSDHPLFPLEKTSADLNIDMVGRIDPEYKNADSANYIYVIGDDKISSDLRRITDEVNKKYSKLTLDRKYNDLKDLNRFYYRSDHYNFAKKGVPVIFYFNGVHPDYHKSTDTVDKINFPLMAKRDHLIFYTAWSIANSNNMLKRDTPLEPE